MHLTWNNNVIEVIKKRCHAISYRKIYPLCISLCLRVPHIPSAKSTQKVICMVELEKNRVANIIPKE